MSTSTDRLRALLASCAVLALAGCATTPEQDPVQVRLDDLDARVGRIDRIVSNQSLMQMAQRVDSLQEELRTLRGRVEELQNDNAVLRKQQRDLYADLDKRLTDAAAAAAASAAASGPAAPEADEQALYNRALEQLRARNYAAAVDGFRTLAAGHPNGQMADNTQYWLGEAYYVTAEYDQAAAAFQRVLSGWPNSRKAPDALLKLGYTQIEQNKLAAARATLQQVAGRYPDTDAARLATERLNKLPK
ncbi:MAG TPA: tol-pal system protein YbgF [Steroidobacteraceae bacterium]|nr:tol-pal system protein YbgF [Steroidobacteraceae bacterium]